MQKEQEIYTNTGIQTPHRDLFYMTIDLKMFTLDDSTQKTNHLNQVNVNKINRNINKDKRWWNQMKKLNRM